jgi:hypothetical protein
MQIYLKNNNNNNKQQLSVISNESFAHIQSDRKNFTKLEKVQILRCERRLFTTIRKKKRMLNYIFRKIHMHKCQYVHNNGAELGEFQSRSVEGIK